VASLIFYTATAPFPGLYVLLRYDAWALAWFSSAVFWLLCVYLTLVSLYVRAWRRLCATRPSACCCMQACYE
jgi:hypothetical protein